MAGNIKGIIVEIGGDTSGLQKALSKVNSATSSLSKELRGVNSLLKLDPSNTEILAQKQTVLTKNIEQTSEKLELLRDIQKQADDAIANGIDISEENYRALQREIANTENKLKSLQSQSSKWSTAGKAVEEFGNKIANVSEKVDKLGNTLTASLTTPILGIGAAAVTTGNDFEAQMSRVQAIAGATKEELEQLTNQAVELGAETSFSASEVAAGMENLASAGFTTEEIMKAMPGMLDLAASSGADLATASEIAASAIRGFGLEASQAGHVADVYAEAAARTNAQTEDMGEAMKYIAPVANTMGLKIEEVAAAIGIMSDAGIKGSQAGTSLRGALVRLTKPTDKMLGVMEDLGISFYDNEGKMKSLTEMIAMLQEATKDLTDEEAQYALTVLFGTESLSGLVALINRGSKDLENMTDSFENCDGAAEEMADTMLDNTKGALESLSGSLESAGIAIQDALSPEIRDLSKWIQDLVDDFNDLSDEEQLNIIKTAGLVAGIGPLTKILGSAGKLLGSTTKNIGIFTQAIGVAIGKTSSESVEVNKLAKALQFLKSPTGVAVTALGALVAILGVAIAKHNEQAFSLQETTDKLKEAEQAQNEFNQSLEDSYNSQMSEIANVEKLSNELDTLVDANGRVKEGYQDRVKFILTELNKALGTEYSLNGDIINSYDEITKSIDDMILKKRAQIILEKEEAKYNQALDEKADAYENLTQAQKEYSKTLQEYNKAILDNDKNAQLVWGAQLQQAQANLNTSREIYQQYLDDIATYDADYQTILSGNNEKINELINQRTYTYQSASGDMAETINHNMQQVQAEIDYYSQAYQTDIDNQNMYSAEKNRIQQEASEKQLRTLVEQLMGMTSTTEELTPLTIEAWKNLANGSYDIYKEYINKMSPEMQQEIQEITGVIANDTSVEDEAGNLGIRVGRRLDEDLDSETSGKNYVKGITKGVQNQGAQKNLFSTISNIGLRMIRTLNNSLDEHSPSKLTDESGQNFIQGFINGAESKEKKAVNSVNKLGNNLIDSFYNGIDGKTLSSSLASTKLNSKVIDSTKTIFTTPTLNIYTQREVNIRQIADEVNRIFGSKY